jgi:predicted lipoprotein with Yx(FWY)xxD motif
MRTRRPVVRSCWALTALVAAAVLSACGPGTPATPISLPVPTTGEVTFHLALAGSTSQLLQAATAVATRGSSQHHHFSSPATTGFALSAAACSGGSGGSASAPVPSANGSLLSAQPTSLGTILVDGKGRTVYEFANDKNGESTCTGGCAANWPFVPAPTSLPTALPGVSGQLGTTTRSDGARQVTIAGHPVYTFAGDSAPGQTKGQGIVLDGGLWTVASPAGAPITTASPAGGGLGY